MHRIEARLADYEKRYHHATGGWQHGPVGAVDWPGDAAGLNYASVELEVGNLYYALVHLLRPRRVLETGTHIGYSTSKLAQGLRDTGAYDGRVVTVDPLDTPHLWDGTDVAPLITWLPRYSQDVVEEVGHATFDLILLDSDHTYDTCMTELVLFEPLLTPGGCVILHDSLFYDGVGLAVKALYASERFEVLTLDTPRHHAWRTRRCPGVTIGRKVKVGPPLAFDDLCRGIEVGDADAEPFLRRYLAADRFGAGAGPPPTPRPSENGVR